MQPWALTIILAKARNLQCVDGPPLPLRLNAQA